MSKAKVKTLFEVLEEQKLGQSKRKKITIVNKKDRHNPTKTIVYLKALNILFDHMDYCNAKKCIEQLSFKELEEIVKNA